MRPSLEFFFLALCFYKQRLNVEIHCVEQQTSINLCMVMIVKIFLTEP